MNSALRNRRAQAFTLVEVMAAAAVMSLGIVGMIYAVATGLGMLDVARKQTIATQIIHGQFENIRLSNWTQVGALETPKTVVVDGSDNGGSQTSNLTAGFVFGSNLPGLSKNFTCTRTITTVQTDMKEVTFVVSWTGSNGRSYSRTGSTRVGKNGLYVTYQIP